MSNNLLDYAKYIQVKVMRNLRKKIFLLFCVGLSACTGHQEPLWEAEECAMDIAKQLHAIQTVDQLKEKKIILSKKWYALAKVMYEVKKRGLEAQQAPYAILLEQELARIYAMDGGRECIEESQRRAVMFLLEAK